MFKKWGAWVSCFSQGVRRSDPFWQGAWVRAQLWNATAAIFPLENRWFPDFCSWKLAKIGHAQRPASQPASQGNEIQLKILNKFNSKSLFLMKILNILLHFNLQKTQNLLKKMQNDQNYPTVGSPSISKSHVGPGIQQKPRIWTLFSLINLWFLHKSVPPAPRPRRGCPAPAPAGRGTPESKKIYKYKIFGAFWREPPVIYRQIIGRSWADHGR